LDPPSWSTSRVSDALRLAGGLKPDAYLGQVLISRLEPDSTRTQLRTALRDTTGAALEDVVLADGDEIQVFSQTEFRPKRYVVSALLLQTTQVLGSLLTMLVLAKQL
jgi:protein involved in polysaccharide export with SLBB domain